MELCLVITSSWKGANSITRPKVLNLLSRDVIRTISEERPISSEERLIYSSSMDKGQVWSGYLLYFLRLSSSSHFCHSGEAGLQLYWQ